MPLRGVQFEEAFRSAIEAGDCSGAEATMQEYLRWFRSTTRTLPEIERARNLFEWGIKLTRDQKVQMAEELMRLKTVFDAYQPRKHVQTWRVVG